MFIWERMPLMEEAGDGGGGGGGGGDVGTDIAVLDPGASDTALDVADDTALETQEDTAATQAIVPFDKSGKPAKQLREALTPLGKSAAQVYRALGVAQRFQRELPGGWAELKTMRDQIAAIEELGGLDQIRHDIHSVEELDRLYTAGDPGMVGQMTQLPEGKVAFQKMMPVAIEKYRQLAPNAFAAYFAQTMLSTMRSKHFLGTKESPVDVEFMWDLEGLTHHIPKTLSGLDAEGKSITVPNPAVAFLTKIVTFVDWLQSLASLQPESTAAAKPDEANTEIENRRKELANEERRLYVERLNGDSQRTANAIFAKHYEAETKGRKITPAQSAEIRTDVSAHTSLAIGQDKAHPAKVRGFVEAKDREGYLRYMQGVYDKNYSKYVKRAVARIVGGKPGPVAVAAPGGVVKTPPDAGWVRGVRPHENEIDYNRTTGEDYRNGKVYMKDGTKRQFR